MSLESFYVVKQLYAMTLNPKDCYQFLGKSLRVKNFHTFFYNIFQNVSYNYELYIEFSEPSHDLSNGKSPRLHFHGVIWFDKIEQIGSFLATGLYHLTKLGYVDITKCNDPDAWQNYCNKQHVIKHNRLSNIVCNS